MALKGAVILAAMGNLPVPNAYIKPSQINGNAKGGWSAYIEIYPDAAAVAAYKVAEDGVKKALAAALAPTTAAQTNPSDLTASSAALTAQAAVMTAQAAMAKLVKPVPLPITTQVTIPYTKGSDPFDAIYTSLKADPANSKLTDA